MLCELIAKLKFTTCILILIITFLCLKPENIINIFWIAPKRATQILQSGGIAKVIRTVRPEESLRQRKSEWRKKVISKMEEKSYFDLVPDCKKDNKSA